MWDTVAKRFIFVGGARHPRKFMQHTSKPDNAGHAPRHQKQFQSEPHVARVLMGGREIESKVQQKGEGCMGEAK
jgi:hypothetical protein